jgi:endonuclease/exonuclease/phosphatase family metal-dependent hydrolase
MASISLVSVNIERSKHLDLVRDFLASRNPDIVCMQELCERDVAALESMLGMVCVYAPSGLHPADPPEQGGVLVGVGIFSRLPIVNHSIEYYSGSETHARRDEIHTNFDDHALITCDIEKEGITFSILTTHFTWTPRGAPDDNQRRDMKTLLEMLATKDEFVLCGDFNAPRMLEEKPGEIFATIAQAYKDNIPAQYLTSLDPARHRAPLAQQADKMVDGLFTTPGYHTSDVELHASVSDHCAITATIAIGKENPSHRSSTRKYLCKSQHD